MSINWPIPTGTGQTYTSPSGYTWIWNGSAWDSLGESIAGPTGPTGPTGPPGTASNTGATGPTGPNSYAYSLLLGFSNTDLDVNATTFAYGNFLVTSASTIVTNPSRQVIVPVSGSVVGVSIMTALSTGAIGYPSASDNVTLIIRNVTTNTNSTITSTYKFGGSSVWTNNAQNQRFTLLTPLPVTAGNAIQMRLTTPTWSFTPNAAIQAVWQTAVVHIQV